jgi:hypothetical protein
VRRQQPRTLHANKQRQVGRTLPHAVEVVAGQTLEV